MSEVNTLSRRVRRIVDNEGWSGIFRRAVAGLEKSVIRPLVSPYYSVKARSSGDTARRYNDFFFAELSVERDAVTKLYRDTAKACEMPTGEMESFHRIAFAALSMAGFAPRKILEIGTLNGRTTQFLATLFPAAQVYTVNLPVDDPLYENWHPDGSAEHDSTLASRFEGRKITALRVNSMWLMKQNLPQDFDLIWLDGGHEYPEVAWDHFFALQKLADDGWIFSDDIHLPQNDPWWRLSRSNAFSVVNYYNTRKPDTFKFILKREEPATFVREPKFIAYHHKTTGQS